MRPWTVYLVIAAVLVVAAGGGGWLRRRVWRRQWERTGWAEWRVDAKGLRWSDRAKVMWANFIGRPVGEPRLAALAARRGESFHATATEVSHRMRWLYRVIGVLAFLLGVLDLTVRQWAGAVWALLFGLAFVFMPQLMRSEARRALRSAQASRDLAEPPPPVGDPGSG